MSINATKLQGYQSRIQKCQWQLQQAGPEQTCPRYPQPTDSVVMGPDILNQIANIKQDIRELTSYINSNQQLIQKLETQKDALGGIGQLFERLVDSDYKNPEKFIEELVEILNRKSNNKLIFGGANSDYNDAIDLEGDHYVMPDNQTINLGLHKTFKPLIYAGNPIFHNLIRAAKDLNNIEDEDRAKETMQNLMQQLQMQISQSEDSIVMIRDHNEQMHSRNIENTNNLNDKITIPAAALAAELESLRDTYNMLLQLLHAEHRYQRELAALDPFR